VRLPTRGDVGLDPVCLGHGNEELKLDTALAALWIAAEEYPSLDPAVKTTVIE